VLQQAAVRNATVVRWGPTVIGLTAIPFIIKPIDHAVDSLMDWGVRPYLLDLPDVPPAVKAAEQRELSERKHQ
jgi:hypothetical protein